MQLTLPPTCQKHWDRFGPGAQSTIAQMVQGGNSFQAERYARVLAEAYAFASKPPRNAPKSRVVDGFPDGHNGSSKIAKALLQSELDRVDNSGALYKNLLTWIANRNGRKFTSQQVLEELGGGQKTLSGYLSHLQNRDVLISEYSGNRAVKWFWANSAAHDALDKELLIAQSRSRTYRAVLAWVINTDGREFTAVDAYAEIDARKNTISNYLSKLTDRGFLESVWVRDGGNPHRKLYRIKRGCFALPPSLQQPRIINPLMLPTHQLQCQVL